MHKYRSILWLLFIFMISPFVVTAQPASVQQQMRFQQVVETICSNEPSAGSPLCQQASGTVCGENGQITEDQLIQFLCRKTKERLDLLPSDESRRLINQELAQEEHVEESQREAEFLAVFSRRQARDKVSNRLQINQPQDNNIDQSELGLLETARLDSPLPPLLKDLLPPNVAMPVSSAPPAKKSLLQRMDEVISLRQSFLDGVSMGKPATFTWTEFGSSDETLEQDRDRSKFEIRGALTYEPNPFQQHEFGKDPKKAVKLSYNPVAVFEVDSSSEDKDKRNSLVHRVGFQSVLYRKLRTGHNFDLTIDYTTDRDYRSDLLGFTVQYTPNAFDIGLGQWLPRRESFAHYIWRPFLGVVASHVQDPGDNADLLNKKDFTHGFARLTAAVLLGSRVKITPEFAWVKEFENEKEDHTAYSLTGQWLFDQAERVSLTVSYEYGESLPTFKKKDVVKVGLGLKL